MNNKKSYLLLLYIFANAHTMLAAAVRPTMLKGPKGKELPAQVAARRAKVVEKRATPLEKGGAFPKRDFFTINIAAYNNRMGSIQQLLPQAQNVLQRGNRPQAEAILSSVQAHLIEAQKLFAELLEQLAVADAEKMAKEFLPLIAPATKENWQNEQRQRLLNIANQLEQIKARMPEFIKPKQTPCQDALLPGAAEPLGSGRALKRQKTANQNPQEQLTECQRCYEDLFARFQQETATHLADKNRYEFDVKGFGEAQDALAKQLDNMKNELEHLQQENAQLKQGPQELPAPLLQELAELRNQVEEIQERARMGEIYRGIAEEQRAAYKKALDTIFAEIVGGYTVEEVENNPKKQAELITHAKAEWSRSIANAAAEQFQQLLAQNLVSKEEIQEQIDKKIEEMMAAVNQPKPKLKAEPPKKK